MNIKLKIWRQKNQDSKGHFEEYAMSGIEEHMSFLEVLDLLNEQLFAEGKEPVAFDSDCREGICGTCGLLVNGRPPADPPVFEGRPGDRIRSGLGRRGHSACRCHLIPLGGSHDFRYGHRFIGRRFYLGHCHVGIFARGRASAGGGTRRHR